MTFLPFYFDIPHGGEPWDDGWFWVLEESEILIFFIGLALSGLTVFLLKKGSTWNWVCIYFAIAGVIPMIGIHGMLLENYYALRTMGRSIESVAVIHSGMWSMFRYGFFANCAFLYALILGVLLILRTMKWIPFNFKEIAKKGVV